MKPNNKVIEFTNWPELGSNSVTTSLIYGYILLNLHTYIDAKGKNKKEREFIELINECRLFLIENISDLIITQTKRGTDINITPRFKEHIIDEAEKQKIVDLLAIRYKIVLLFITEQIFKPTFPEKEKLHKQPRNLLKTLSKTIGDTTDKPTLFTMPIQTENIEGVIAETRQQISKNTGALALHLIQTYQQIGNKNIVITNLNELAEILGCNNYRLKLYLLFLGGYTYPFIDIDYETNEIVMTTEQLFKIEFRFSRKKLSNKYIIENKQVIGAERIGTTASNFIKNEEVERVIVTPNQRFIDALEGKGLGNIMAVNDTFVSLILELSDIATKILAYSSSNKPNWKISEDNLIKHLGLEKQLKKQGRPRIRTSIIKGLEELQDKGHIEKYVFNEEEMMYTYTYTDKFVKYKTSKKEKNT
jgi:hypothetical protein